MLPGAALKGEQLLPKISCYVLLFNPLGYTSDSVMLCSARCVTLFPLCSSSACPLKIISCTAESIAMIRHTFSAVFHTTATLFHFVLRRSAQRVYESRCGIHCASISSASVVNAVLFLPPSRQWMLRVTIKAKRAHRGVQVARHFLWLHGLIKNILNSLFAALIGGRPFLSSALLCLPFPNLFFRVWKIRTWSINLTFEQYTAADFPNLLHKYSNAGHRFTEGVHYNECKKI